MSYVGITGFKTREQVDALRTEAPIGYRRLSIGVLANYHTIMEGRWKPDGRDPEREKIATIFRPQCDHGYNLVHYYTKNPTNLGQQLVLAKHFGGPYCHGLQLNIAWPDPDAIRELQDSQEGNELILVIQLGGRRWPITDYEPRELALKVLNLYDGMADYVLLDPSGGLGRQLEVDVLLPYLESLDAYMTAWRRPARLVIAGGLCVNTLEKIRPFCEQFPGLSFDAEAKLHSESGQLDLDRCRQYLTVARTLP